MSEEQDRLVIEVPAEPEAVGSARLFATAVARMSGVDDESVEDIRLAISEAVTERVRSAEPDDPPVSVAALIGEKSVTFEIFGGGPARDRDGALGLAVIRSLFPAADVDEDPPVVRFAALREPVAPDRDQEFNRRA